MAVHTDTISVRTSGEVDIIDITGKVQRVVDGSGLKGGTACVFVSGSTGAITTVEYEPGLLQDIPQALERLFPRGMRYEHHERWHDGNGHSHVRASFLGPSLTVPFTNGQLMLGTWQQIVFAELDVRARKREIVVQVMGE